MIAVEEIISELILHHSCVILPEFGGFVSKPISAQINAENGVFLPPSKQLLFNKHLITNDGLLISEFSTRNSIAFNDSENHVSEFVKSIKLSLKNFHQYTLPKIGVFHLDEEGNINFEQDRHFNFLLNAYGLSQIQFVANQQKETKEEIDIATIAPIVELKSKKRSILRYAAAACILPLAFYSIWIPAKSDVLESGLISYKDFNPFYKKEVGSYKKQNLNTIHFSEVKNSKEVKKISSEISSIELTENNLVFVKTEKEVSIEQVTPAVTISNKPKKNVKSLQSNTKRFEFVVGCFANQENAENLKTKLLNEGFQVRLNTAGSLVRVILGGAQSMDSLQEIITKANALGYDGWILKN